MPLPGMDRPPLPSPEIQSQMGTPQPPPPGAGLSQLKPSDQGAPAAGAPNPHGFLLAQVDSIKKVLNQIANAEPTFAPFAQKAIQIMETGTAAVSTAPKAGGPEGGPEGQAAPPQGGNMPALG